ncbi:MAG: efflux RND transporter periplasmic adaptor subunit [Ignavibacteriae bacterium]|nr:efflux RND transporter periplasmic adaptor subunit [Ignavibacteriota bacterium]
MTKKTKITFIVAGVVLVGLAIPKLILPGKTNQANGAGAGQRDGRLSVRTVVVQPERLRDRVETVGTILSNEEVEVRPEISGRIVRLSFKEGGRVAKGQLLIKINDADLKAQLMRAEASLKLEREREARMKALYEKDLASKAEYDNVATNLNLADAEVRLIRAQIAKTEIRAPFDGNIGLRFVSEGSYVTPTTAITTLQNLGVVKIDFAIPERYAGSFAIGDKISFSIQNSPRTFSGAVYAIQPKIDPTTRTLRLRALSPNKEGALLPGSLASVEVSMREKSVLMIPAYAIIPELKGHKVFLFKNGKAEQRNVDTGTRTEDKIEITGGLSAGDTVITSAILQIRPGMSVQLARPASQQSMKANGDSAL